MVDPGRHHPYARGLPRDDLRHWALPELLRPVWGSPVLTAAGNWDGRTPPPALALGEVLDGRYRIGQVLGHGGFGITYLAWDENLQLRLAIKEYLPRDSASRAPNGVSLAVYSGRAGEQFAYGLDRFLEEARALAHFVQHPGIVTVTNFFRAHGTGYCVMDYVEGITLGHYLVQQPEGRISVEAALRLLTPVMDALRAVHKEGLLHRDLAPDNIYMSRTGRIKLLDFGAARFAAGEHSKSLSIILKPGYAPEEQYRTKGQQGPWTDVYGLAATFYRAITGQLPPESLDRIDDDDLAPPSDLGVATSARTGVRLAQGPGRSGDAALSEHHGVSTGWSAVDLKAPVQMTERGGMRRPRPCSHSHSRTKEKTNPRSSWPPLVLRPSWQWSAFLLGKMHPKAAGTWFRLRAKRAQQRLPTPESDRCQQNIPPVQPSTQPQRMARRPMIGRVTNRLWRPGDHWPRRVIPTHNSAWARCFWTGAVSAETKRGPCDGSVRPRTRALPRLKPSLKDLHGNIRSPRSRIRPLCPLQPFSLNRPHPPNSHGRRGSNPRGAPGSR